MKNEKVVVNQSFILDLFQDRPHVPFCKDKGNNKCERCQDPVQKHYGAGLKVMPRFGMTTLFNNGGFTLIELLVVVLIIGILAAVALPQYQKAVAKSRYNTLKDLTNNIAQAEELYYWEHGTYSDDFSKLAVEMPGGNINTASTQNYRVYNWGDCHLGIRATDTYVTCRSSLAKMNYLLYLHQHPTPFYRGKRVCVAADKDMGAMQSKICQQETGKQAASGTSNGRYVWYY